jgi:hypothetical protein
MRRREFIAIVGGVAAAWPLAARAQQPAMPVIGLLNSRSPGDAPQLLAATLRGLKDTGFVEVKISRSNIASPRIKTNACLRWRPIWFVVR